MSNTGNTLINTKGDVVSNLNSEIISIGRANNSNIYWTRTIFEFN